MAASRHRPQLGALLHPQIDEFIPRIEDVNLRISLLRIVFLRIVNGALQGARVLAAYNGARRETYLEQETLIRRGGKMLLWWAQFYAKPPECSAKQPD